MTTRMRIYLALILIVAVVFVHNHFKYGPKERYKVSGAAIYLSGDLEAGNKDVVAVTAYLRAMNKGDKVTIFVNTHGGEIIYMYQIINAIHESKGDVTVVADGMAASAGFLIMVQAKHAIASENGYVIAHLARINTPKGVCVLPISNRDQYALVELILNSKIDRLFTEPEMRGLLQGKDIVFSNREFNRRIAAREQLPKQGLGGTISIERVKQIVKEELARQNKLFKNGAGCVQTYSAN